LLKKSLAMMVLLISGFALMAQVNEKDLVVPKDPALLNNIFNNRADSAIGNLNGAPTYDRIFTGSVDPNCNAPSTLSGIGTGVPYVVYEIFSTTGENLVGAINPAGTDVADTTLSLYCDPFNPADAQANLVAYNDDFGSLLSGFDGTEGAFMAAGTSYFLVVSLFGPTSIGGGNFQLDLGGNIQIGSPCTIDGMVFNADNSVTIDGICLSGVDLYVERLDGSTQFLSGGISVDGPTDVPVTFFPDSMYFVTPAGSASPILASTGRTVPTLSQWALIAFLALLAGAGLFFMRKRRLAAS